MRDLAGFIIFIYAFNLIITKESIFGLCLFTIMLIIFVINNLRQKCVIENFNKISRKSLHKQKKFFLETMTHDFKIPTLAQLRGLELLKNGVLGDLNNEQKELIKQIESSCKYVLDMISMFANVYMFENENYKLIYEKFSMSDLVYKCFTEISEIAKEKNITFSYTSTQDDTILEADKSEIKKVLINLLTNAVNYSKCDSRIDVKTEILDSQIQLSISGMGLAYGNKKFAEENRYTTIGHTLGMYLCKKIIEVHKGRIFLTDNNKNSNSFSFILPRSAENTEAETAY